MAGAVGMEDVALVEALRGGGYNLYFRHAATDWSQTDRVVRTGDWTSCDSARIRQLSNQGRESARRIGGAMRTLGIPVDKVYASPYCRAVQTAEALAVGPIETTTDVMNLRVADHFGGREAIVKTARARLASRPPEGWNVVYVAHGNVAREATPVYPNEGEAVVFRPGGDDAFDFVARISPARWQQLVDAWSGSR